jgi:beta-alanine degradation protein BauB
MEHATVRAFRRLAISAGMLAIPLFCAAEPSSNLPVSRLEFFDTGVGPLKAAPAYGDLSKGAHSTFVKLPAGFVSPRHYHTSDYYGVVVTGIVANAPTAKSADVPLPPGSYWYQAGKENHVTKCLSATECVVFITQHGKFDEYEVEGK